MGVYFYFSEVFKDKNSTTNVIKQQTELSIQVICWGWSLSGSASNIDLKICDGDSDGDTKTDFGVTIMSSITMMMAPLPI